MIISHISDLHIDNEQYRENIIKFEQVLYYLSQKKIDHLIITGDISQNAKTEPMKNVRSIMERYGFMSPEKATVIIGNHDIFGGVFYAHDVIRFPSKCRRTDYNKMIKEFTHIFKPLFENCKFINKDDYYPFVKEFDGLNLYGVNSIARYSYLKNPFASNGNVKKDQLKMLEELILNSSHPGRKNIMLIHHHFHRGNQTGYSSVWQRIERQTMKLHNKKKLENLFAKYGINLVLHGHRHDMNEYTINGVKYLNAGGSILNTTANVSFINMIKVEADGIQNYMEAVSLDKSDSNYFKIKNSGINLQQKFYFN